MNAVVWESVFQRYSVLAKTVSCLGITGTLKVEDVIDPHEDDLYKLTKNSVTTCHLSSIFAAPKIITTDRLQLQVSLVRLGARQEDHQDKRG